MRFVTIIIGLFCISTAFGEVTIQGPNQLDVKEADLFPVNGVTVEEFAKCSVYARPEEGHPRVLILKTLDNKPVLFVKGLTPGKFDIILDVNIVGKYELVFHTLTIGKSPETPSGTFAEFVVDITEDVESEGNDEVSKVFFAIASGIKGDKLRGSKAIIKEMDEKMAKIDGWWWWLRKLKVRMLKDLFSQGQWHDACLVVGKEVVR